MWPPLSQAWPYHPLRRLPKAITAINTPHGDVGLLVPRGVFLCAQVVEKALLHLVLMQPLLPRPGWADTVCRHRGGNLSASLYQ